ncbi:uncharacterized protein JCM6883_007138 [Sporobolomyces salmoneus]|uniref:uncharacterized protein n=1 Tax=Sporobolomyces salmoneus TaxID=183962 RepID=UPI0031774946
MPTPRTPQRVQSASLDASTSSTLDSASPSRPHAVSRIQKPQVSASPQIKAALAALRKNRQTSNSPSLNSASSAASSEPDPFSTPPRASTSNLASEPSASRVESPSADQFEEGDLGWAKKNETRLIEAAKKTGLLNFASQGISKVSPAVYSALLPRSSPYHPSRRHRSTYRETPTSFSFTRDENETAWFEQCDLKSLNLANNELETVDEEVGGFEDLEFLDLHGNLLTTIPLSLGHLVHLTSLNLASNEIHQFPIQIVNLRFLRDLNLSHNKLENLWTSAWDTDLSEVLSPPETSPSATPESPERIRDFFTDSRSKKSQPELSTSSSNCPFPLLQTLNLAGNAFEKSTFTSNGFEFPPQLKTLDLSSSQLIDASLPPLLVGRLKDLTEFDLSDNGFTEDLFSPDLFPVDSTEPLFPSLRLLYLSLNPIDQLGSIEHFLTDYVSRPIEYDGLAKTLTNLVKSEEQRLRGGKRIGIRLVKEGEVGPELEVRVRECPLESEQDRRRAKFPGPNGVTAGSGSRISKLSVPLQGSTSTSASPSSSPPRSQPLSPSLSTDSQLPGTPNRKQVVLEEWEIEAAAGLSTPAGRRKAAAQAAREQAERKRQEEMEKRRMKEERAKQVQLEEEQRLAKEAEELERKMAETTLGASREGSEDSTTSPPPYSPRESTTGPPSDLIDEKQPSSSSSSTTADPSDPAFALIMSSLSTSTRTVNLSNRSLSTLPSLTTGSPPSYMPVPTSLDLSRNVLTCLPLASIESWNWSTSLRTLTITHNRLSSLLDSKAGSTLTPLSVLTTLDLSNNHLTSTSDKPLLSLLHNLCPSLRTLSLSYNRLTTLEGIDSLLLPDASGARPTLRILNLNGNKISDTTALCQVGEKIRDTGETKWSLEELDLRDNEIARLQPTLGLLPHSLIISVSGNTFRFPRREIWENPGQRLLLPNLRERLG